MKHTALPFIQEQQFVYSEDSNGNIIAVCDCSSGKEYNEDLANAEFIVQACNAHEDLLKACKILNEWLRSNTKATNRPASLDKLLMDAIAKAE